MLKLTSGRIVFFEGIISAKENLVGLTLELANKEKITIASTTLKEFLKLRTNYFAQNVVEGKVTQEFGDKIFVKLQTELKTAIETLQTATTAYNISAELANKASTVLASTSDRVDLAADKLFQNSESRMSLATTKFKQVLEDTCENRVHKTAHKFDLVIKKLEEELGYVAIS